MNFLFVVLLSATIHQVFCKEKELKCPPRFQLYYRNPTERNNHTSEYCLGVFPHNETYDHDTALALCNSINTVLTYPENHYEWVAVSRTLNSVYNNSPAAKNKTTVYMTVDGFFNPQCKNYSDTKHYRKHNENCKLENNLYLFQDVNTDPSFLLSQFKNKEGVPKVFKNGTDQSDIFSGFIKIPECLSLDTTVAGGPNVVDHMCSPMKGVQFMGALCGARPVLA